MVPDQGEGVCKVGSIIYVGGQRATVKYVGCVDGTKGEWIGVDWDDPKRGKHNGTHNDRSYFKTKCETSGSFIRPAKANFGISIVEAIQQRYGLVEVNAGIDIENLVKVQKDIGASLFEVVGAEKVNKKQSQFESLQIVSLREQAISCAGPPLALLRLCPNITELDLSKTLISSWDTIAQISRQLPNLQLLDVSENRLSFPGGLDPKSFDSVHHLVMARNDATWEDIIEIASLFRHLTVLQTPFNNIDRITITRTKLDQIKCLDLEGNPIKDWEEINKLGRLQHLETLNVTACSISEISIPDAPSSNFPALRHLLVGENKICDWRSISELDKLPVLQELKCLKNPVLDRENFETNHQLIIARISRLKVLNGLSISPEERRGAELDFLKLHGREWLSLSSESERRDFDEKHPCYQRLVNKYGAPEESELKKAATCLKSNLVEIEICAPGHSERRFKKKLPPTMMVQKLTGLAQRLFDTGTAMPQLSLLHSTTEVPLDNELKSLSYYSVDDGALIAVRW